MDESRRPQEPGLSDALRAALDSTLARLGDPRSATTGWHEGVARAGDLLDEVARRGRDVRAEIGRRGEEAREEVQQRGIEALDASATITIRLLEAVSDSESKPKVEAE